MTHDKEIQELVEAGDEINRSINLVSQFLNEPKIYNGNEIIIRAFVFIKNTLKNCHYQQATLLAENKRYREVLKQVEKMIQSDLDDTYGYHKFVSGDTARRIKIAIHQALNPKTEV